MLNPGTVLFLCVVVAGCGGSLRELKAQLRAKRARALGLHEDQSYDEEGGQCGYCYPEDQENPRNWDQYQVSLQQPGVQGQSYPGHDGPGRRLPGYPGMEPGQGYPGQMNQEYAGQHPGINPMVQILGQGPNTQNFPSHSPHTPNFPRPPSGTSQEGLPPGANAPYCYTEDGQPRIPGMPPGTSPGVPSSMREFMQRWRSPLLSQPAEQTQPSSMAPGNPNPYQFSGPPDQSFQQHTELPGSKLRNKLDALLHPSKKPHAKYSPLFSSNYHHPQMHHAPKTNVLPSPKMYPKFSDVMERTAESESKSTDLPSEWTQQPYSRNQPNCERPSTTTTRKPLSSFFSDFMPKYVETVPPPTCPISPSYHQEADQQQAAPDYEQQPDSRQPAPYEQPSDHHASQHNPSRHHYDAPNGPPYDHRSQFAPKSFQQN